MKKQGDQRSVHEKITWQKLDDKRLIGHHSAGIDIVVPIDDKGPVPFDCPVCFMRMRHGDDTISFTCHGCCDSCSIRWALPHASEWIEGWRPSDAEIDAAFAARPGYKLRG